MKRLRVRQGMDPLGPTGQLHNAIAGGGVFGLLLRAQVWILDSDIMTRIGLRLQVEGKSFWKPLLSGCLLWSKFQSLPRNSPGAPCAGEFRGLSFQKIQNGKPKEKSKVPVGSA